jgi:uncharacterized protein (DUF2141 family)
MLNDSTLSLFWKRSAPLALLVGLLHASAAMAQTAGDPSLTVYIEGVEGSRGGEIRCALWSQENGFPSEAGASLQGVAGRESGGRWVCEFSLPAEGTYAVSVMHDENGNDEVDRNMMGIPTEGWATSQNVRPSLRAPRFSESTFATNGPNSTISVIMRY